MFLFNNVTIKDVYDKWQAGSVQSIITYKECMSAYYNPF